MYKNDRVTRRYSEPFKLKILAELSTGKYTKSQLGIKNLSKNIKVDIEKHNISKAENIVTQVKELKLSKELLYPKEFYKLESFESVTNRYNGFGKKLYSKLKTENSEIFDNLKFYQMLNEKEDSYAEYIDDNVSFVIQLDFYNDLICIWNYKATTEIGSWENDEIKTSISFILKEFLTK